MQLYYSATSPYARKVRVVAIEKGLDGQIELVDAMPWPDPSLVAARNPLGKVPALVLNDGTALYDSPVICEYLDVTAGGTPLLPTSGAARWAALRTQALADGLLDAAVSIVLERRRPPAQQSDVFVERSVMAIRRALATLAADVAAAPEDPFDLARIATAIAVGYLHFRLPDLTLGLDDSRLDAWWSMIRGRPSMLATEPA